MSIISSHYFSLVYLTLLFPVFDPPYCGTFNLQITWQYYTNSGIHNTAKSILKLAHLLMGWHFITHHHSKKLN